VTERALVLIDGEHYAPVVRDALEALPYEVVGALLVGGTEKLRGGDDYGAPLVAALDAVEADLVVDLSDEPVLGPRERMLWASRALALGLPYVGADFRFEPPPLDPIETPSLAVIGLGKRIGKTAVAGHVARVLARDRRVVVVAMGRGGPAEPELVEAPPALDDLLALARSGRHAASDHLEAAALAGVPAVGCRRAGGGLAGAPFRSNVLDGARLAAQLGPDLLVFDGSGAALPPVAVDARILVTNGNHDPRAGLNAYRVLVSDLVVDTGGADRESIRSISDLPVVAAELRLRPAEPLRGRRTAVFTTGAAPTEELDAEIVHVSRNLARRDALREELGHVDAEVYLVELKAAAVDVVAEAALARGAEVVLAANDVVSDELDERIADLARQAVRA
jgi:cyclic 2,3-diphosphoglycerate synthase